MDSLAKEYRELLTRDESLTALDRCLRLAERVLGVRIAIRDMTPSLEPLSRPDQRYSFVAQVIEGEKTRKYIPQDLDQAIEVLSEATGDRRQILRVTRVAVTLAVLPRLAKARESEFPESRYSLFMDSCMLVFHHAYFALLPALEGQARAPARRVLLNCFKAFAGTLGRAADTFTVLALCYDAAEDTKRAAQYYREAFLATHSDDEDFMSRLQTCWTFMLERAQYREALTLLLDAYPSVARKDLDEMKELMQTTFELSSQGKVAAGR